jgi:hypothetical protein
MDILIDFDGTCVSHAYPGIGVDIGAAPVLKELIANGHRLILFTMRDKEDLEDAVNWFKKNDIELFGIQTNPTQKSWTESPKAHGQLHIDDCGLGCPIKFTADHGRVVDWVEVRKLLVDLKMINNE